MKVVKQSCVDYGESQGIDPLDAAMTVGCSGAPSLIGHDVISGLIFVLSLALGAVTSYRAKPTDEKHNIFR